MAPPHWFFQRLCARRGASYYSHDCYRRALIGPGRWKPRRATSEGDRENRSLAKASSRSCSRPAPEGPDSPHPDPDPSRRALRDGSTTGYVHAVEGGRRPGRSRSRSHPTRARASTDLARSAQIPRGTAALGMRIHLRGGWRSSRASAARTGACSRPTIHRVPGPSRISAPPNRKNYLLPRLAKGMISRSRHRAASAATPPRWTYPSDALGLWIRTRESVFHQRHRRRELVVRLGRRQEATGSNASQIPRSCRDGVARVEVGRRCQFMGLKGIENGVPLSQRPRPKDMVLFGEGKPKLALITLTPGSSRCPPFRPRGQALHRYSRHGRIAWHGASRRAVTTRSRQSSV